jgi:hypothetical protein
MAKKARWFAGIVLALAGFASQAQLIAIKTDPRGTYLRTNFDNAPAAVPIALAGLGLKPGDRISITRLGDFNCHSSCGDLSTGMIAVFSSSNLLLASDQAHRVPGAIDAGVDIVTSRTFFSGVATDIPEDFEVSGTGVVLTIPAGAAFLFVAAHDSLYGDNGDPDGDFAVRIEQLPAANAGVDQSVTEGAVVALDGSASTGQNPTFSWVQLAGPTVQLGDSTLAKPSFTAPELPGGFGSQVLTFQLTVTSGAQSSSDAVDVTVRNVNHAPLAEAGADQTVAEGRPATLDGSASFDPDDDTLAYQWIQTGGPMVELAGANTARPTFTTPLLPGGAIGFETLTFALTASDGALSSTDMVQVTVEQVNHAPLANAGADQTRNEGAVVTLDATGSSDPDGDPIRSYTWSQLSGPLVGLSDSFSPTPTFTAPMTGAGGATLVFALAVSDGFLDSTDDQVTIHVLDVNDPPRCDAAQPGVPRLWPPNHKMVSVGITGIVDPDNDQVQIAITGVTQDEPVNGLGDGDTSPDAVIQGNRALLRAERDGSGNGRVYQIHFSASDSQATGGSCTGSVVVQVPHSMSAGGAAAPDGQVYDSTLP